jgi:hypothetical protein
MSYYEKIPVIIEAWEMTKNNIIEMYSLVNKIHKEEITEQEKDKIIENSLVWGLDIPTLEDGEDRRAKHVASIGDYIIKGLQGEYYPVKPDIFKMSYRLVDDDNYLKKQLRDVTVDIQELEDLYEDLDQKDKKTQGYTCRVCGSKLNKEMFIKKYQIALDKDEIFKKIS